MLSNSTTFGNEIKFEFNLILIWKYIGIGEFEFNLIWFNFDLSTQFGIVPNLERFNFDLFLVWNGTEIRKKWDTV